MRLPAALRPRVARRPDDRVTTLELFFDLVFVLTITQLTDVVHADPGVVGLGVAFLILVNIWWMYSGYAWLTNNVSTATLPRRLLLFVAMGAFLVMAIATPHAFGSSGLAFGIAYLVVITTHFVLFRMAFSAESTRAVLRTAPYNLASALLLVAAGFVEGAADWWLWGSAVAIHIVMLEVGRSLGYSLRAAHLVERHGVVLIVALGESVVALGLGIGDQTLTWPLVFAAVLGLSLAAALWWLYFSENESLAERALDDSAANRTGRIAAVTFGYGFTALLMGIVVSSAGLKDVFAHPYGQVELSGALLLAGGCALYIFGIAIFRRGVGAAGARRLLAYAAAIALAALTTPVGEYVSGFAQTLVLVALLLGLSFATRSPRGAAEAR
ncbi:MAG TPA: low temperature requirement protein A [Terrimesophilobacter sp.]|uniref:low temperature requirement protein A n=1 Tax=Terrimesophilobacter sp. TaxID=2906435 RepID=UPI002F937D49